MRFILLIMFIQNRYPNYNRVSLAAVKNGIYHPDLSTIQKNVNESLLSKFSIENSKTSTALDNG